MKTYQTVLALVDGMRPDGVERAQHTFLSELRRRSAHCFHARTVMPSMTLPCHASLFFSVTPERHGITTNTWQPMARPIDSLGDAFARAGKKAAMFYNWEELRDLNRPGSLHHSHYQTEALPLDEGLACDTELARLAIDYLRRERPDFLFLYLGYTDSAGHGYGWMGEEYLRALSNASRAVETLAAALPEDACLIVTADHGGHGRSHGMDIDEDMTIPVLFCGEPFEKDRELQQLSILDIAPTIARLGGVPAPLEWEGTSIL